MPESVYAILPASAAIGSIRLLAMTVRRVFLESRAASNDTLEKETAR